MASVLIPLAQGCEELEAVTIIDLLRRAGVEVITASLDKQPVKASRGIVLLADMDLNQALKHSFDMLVLPGGLPGADHLEKDMRIRSLIQKMYEEENYIAAICAAPKVLDSAGILQGKSVTSFPGVLDAASNIDYKTDSVVQDGKIITSRGPGTAMDFALSLIENLVGKTKRDEVELALQRP